MYAIDKQHKGPSYGSGFGGSRSMVKSGLTPMWQLVGIAIGLAVIAVVAALSLLPTGASAGLISATTSIIDFLGLIGLGVAVGLLIRAFSGRGM